jgi:hypothetical protein
MDSKKSVIRSARATAARAKHSTARESKSSSEAARDVERPRRTQQWVPKSEAMRRRMSEPPRRRFDLLGHYEKWTQEELDMLGTLPDREVARLIGRSVGAVRAKRFELRTS